MGKDLTGFEAWGKAFGLLLGFMSIRAAIYAIREAEGMTPTSEQVLLLRSIDNKLEAVVPPEPVADLDYYEIL